MTARLRLATVIGVAILSAACTGSATSPAPATPVGPDASPAATAETYWLRMTTWQAIPPLDQFASQPLLVITGDGVVVSPGPIPAIYPGPLLPNLVERSITPAGEEAIVAAARHLGVLGPKGDFTGEGGPLGAVTGRIEITVDGSRVTLTGKPDAQIECVTTPCEPRPGTPEAFGDLWWQLLDLPSWVGTELGPEALYSAPAYALLVQPAPQADPDLPQAPADWPLDQPLVSFGGPVANGTARCGSVSGADADALRPLLAAANELTPWVEASDPATMFGVLVRPLTPGEDACREVFAGG